MMCVYIEVDDGSPWGRVRVDVSCGISFLVACFVDPCEQAMVGAGYLMGTPPVSSGNPLVFSRGRGSRDVRCVRASAMLARDRYFEFSRAGATLVTYGDT